MDKKFLTDYEAREREEYERYVKKVLDVGLDNAGIYPPSNRFNRLNDPLVRSEDSVYYTDNEKIWSQIPFAGTLLISLYNCAEENLLRWQGFDVGDIDKLIDLAKETGKVQFGLRADPTLYEGLDHLDPIFTELKPPVFTLVPLESLTDLKTFDLWREEYFTLSSIKFDLGLASYVHKMGESKEFFLHARESRANAYAKLKLLKLDEIVETISNLLIDDPVSANNILEKYFVLLNPKFDTLKANQNVSLSMMKRRAINATDLETTTYPVEIGRYIMKKLVQHPTSYHACVNVIENYKHNDLYNLLQNLDTAIKNRKNDRVEENVKELDIVLDNIWNEAKKIEQQKENIRTGISVALGIIGEFATSAGGNLGILAGLGFNVVDRKLETFNSSISEKIAKAVNSNFMVNIYDFTDKYLIKS